MELMNYLPFILLIIYIVDRSQVAFWLLLLSPAYSLFTSIPSFVKLWSVLSTPPQTEFGADLSMATTKVYEKLFTIPVILAVSLIVFIFCIKLYLNNSMDKKESGGGEY